MDSTNYTGSYVGIAGVVVMILTHFGINATVDQILAVIGAIAVVVGIVHQAIEHKKLAQNIQQ